MIVQIRVEDKVISNAAVMCIKEMKTPNILVADDSSATSDKLMATQIKLAVDQGNYGKCMIKTTDDAIKTANDPRAKDMRMVVLTRRVSDIYKIFKGCPGLLESVNLARFNYREERLSPENTVRLSGGVLSKEEVEQLREVEAAGIPVFRHYVSTDRKETLEDMLKEAGL